MLPSVLVPVADSIPVFCCHCCCCCCLLLLLLLFLLLLLGCPQVLSLLSRMKSGGVQRTLVTFNSALVACAKVRYSSYASRRLSPVAGASPLLRGRACSLMGTRLRFFFRVSCGVGDLVYRAARLYDAELPAGGGCSSLGHGHGACDWR